LQFHPRRVDELDEDLQGQGRALTAFMTRRFELLPSTAQSFDPVRSEKPAVIVSSNGMATGGRVLNHLKRMLLDPRHTVLFVGYRAAGTRERVLVDGAKQVKMHGRIVDVAARIALIASMSAHADQGEILQWLNGVRRPPAMRFVVHGEPPARDAPLEKIRAMPGWNALAPEYAQGVEL
jgi:metallo-beta-lactamase family protein